MFFLKDERRKYIQEVLSDMKKIKSLFLKIKSKKTIKTYQQPLLITILTLLFINLLLIITAAIIGVNIDPEYFGHDFLKALVHFFKSAKTQNMKGIFLYPVDQNNSLSDLSAYPRQ